MVTAPIRLAMKRSRSGLMVRSSVDTAYQLGFDRHAACLVLPVSRALWNGPSSHTHLAKKVSHGDVAKLPYIFSYLAAAFEASPAQAITNCNKPT